jgi:AraC family transcriptional regulator
MAIPDKTSAEGFERYIGGQSIRVGRGPAWAEIKAWIIAPPRHTDVVPFPSVSEPALSWTFSGEAEFKEREPGQPWVTHRIQKGSFFLTSGGAPYDCRWRVLSPEPFKIMLVFLELPLLQRAFEEVFGAEAPRAQLRDLSAFTDPMLDWMMARLQEELMRRKASALAVQGLAQTIAVYLARHYAEAGKAGRGGNAALPGFKLQQLTAWMRAHLAEPFALDQLAAQAGLSKFHFHRLFKSATGIAPAHFFNQLRMDEARRLLRESPQSIVAIALELGFANPSHFAQAFRREAGLTPSAYRRQR